MTAPTIPCQKCFEDKPFAPGTMWCQECAEREATCTGCGKVKDDVERRCSFGIYAGRLCIECCSGYKDNCGEGEAQGDPTTLHEFEAGGWDAITGEE